MFLTSRPDHSQPRKTGTTTLLEKASIKSIDQLIAKHEELSALPTQGGCYFFTVALAAVANKVQEPTE